LIFNKRKKVLNIFSENIRELVWWNKEKK